jgi:hypothetical protein
VRPDPQRPRPGQLLEPGEQRRPDPLAPGAGRDDQLGLGVVGAVVAAALEPGVADERAAGSAGEDVGAAGRPAVLQPQLGLLGQRPCAVGLDGLADQRQDGGDVVGGRPRGDLDAGVQDDQTSSAGVASAAAAARAAAAVASATCWSSL